MQASRCAPRGSPLVPTGALDPDAIHTPGIYVQRIVRGERREKRIEFATVREER